MEEKEMETGIQSPVPDEEQKVIKVAVVGGMGIGKSGNLVAAIEELRQQGYEIINAKDMNKEEQMIVLDSIVMDPMKELTDKMITLIDEERFELKGLPPIIPKRKYTKPSYHKKNFWE